MLSLVSMGTNISNSVISCRQLNDVSRYCSFLQKIWRQISRQILVNNIDNCHYRIISPKSSIYKIAVNTRWSQEIVSVDRGPRKLSPVHIFQTISLIFIHENISSNDIAIENSTSRKSPPKNGRLCRRPSSVASEATGSQKISLLNTHI